MKILHISDLHFDSENERDNLGNNYNLNKVQDNLCQLGADLAIISGDLTSDGCVHSSSLMRAKEWIDGLGIPYIAIPGNHDLGANLWRSDEYPNLEYYEQAPFEQTNFGKVFKQSSVVSKRVGEVVVIGVVLRENDPDDALKKLENTIKDIKQPIILCGHYPLVPTRNKGILKSFGFEDFIPKTAKSLQRIINKYNQIKIYACGHVHSNTVKQITTSCWQITAGGLGPGPSTYRIYSLSNQSLQYQTLLGAGPLDFWGHSDIDSSDTLEYHLGKADERFGCISL